MKKRILALVLTVAMLLSLLPVQVFAAETETATTEQTQQSVQTQQTPQVEDTSAPVQSQGVPQRGETTGILSLLDYEAAIEDLTELSKNIGIRVAGSENEIKAQDYVAAEFREMGYEVTRQDFSIPNGTSQNVFGVKKAGVETDLTIYISAHIDTVSPSPGANDDGSGIVGMLAIARAMKDIETKSNIVFVSCGAEEIGIYGSKYFAGRLTSEERANAIGNYNMDMVATSYEACKYMVMMSASRETVNGIETYDNHTTRLAREAARSLGYGEEHFKTVYGVPSDHSSFHNVGIPAVQFYWASDNTSFKYNGVEPAMHTAGDNMENNFSQERFQLMVDAIALAVYNDATADYAAVVGEGATREYYTDMAEANAAAGTKMVTDLKAHQNHDGVTFETELDQKTVENMISSSGETYGIDLLEGSYVLTEDLNVAGIVLGDFNLSEPAEVNICLHGHKITMDSYASTWGPVNLNIYDCTGTGKIHSTAESEIAVNAQGSALWIYDSKSTVNLYGGNISSNGDFGILVEAGTVNLHNGSVTGDTAVCVRSLSWDPTYVGNLNISSYLVPKGTNADIYLGGGAKINIGRGFEPDAGETYRIQLDNAGLSALQAGGVVQITEGYGASGYTGEMPFESVHAGYDIFTMTVDNKTEVYIGTVPHEHCVYGEVCPDEEAGQECNHTKVWFESPVDSSNFTSILSTSGHYYLTENVELASDIGFNGGGEIYLCLNGFSITGNRKLTLSGGVKLYLCNCKREAETDGVYHISLAEVGSGEFYFYSGTLVMNSASSSTVKVGKFVVDGGTFIADPGTGNEEANVYVNRPSESNIILKSGRVENKGAYSSAVCQSGAGYVTLDGDIELSGGSSLADIWLFPASSYKPLLITIGENFDPKGQIYTVRLDGVTLALGQQQQMTSGWSNANLDYIPFESTQGYVVKEIDGELYLVGAHYHPLSEGGKPVEFQPLTIPAEGTTLTTGDYVLTGPATVNSGATINVTGDVNLCLAGNTLDLSSGVITVQSDATLNICDCSTGKTGKITGSSTRTIKIESGGGLNLYSGIVESTGNYMSFAISNSGETTLYGGTVVDLNGTAIQISSGTVTIDSDNLTITGGNSAISVSGTLKLSGSPVINGGGADIHLVSKCKITLGGTLAPKNGETYSVRLGSDLSSTNLEHVFTAGWTEKGHGAEEMKYFTSVNQAYAIEEENGELVLKAHFHGETQFDKPFGYDEFTALSIMPDDSRYLHTGRYYLTEDFEADRDVAIQNSAVVYLCLNGHKITGNKSWIMSNSTLYICDCKNSGHLYANVFKGYYSDIHLQGGTVHQAFKEGSSNQHTNFYIEGGALVSEPGTASGSATIYSVAGSQSIVLTSGKLKENGSGWVVAHLGAGKVVLNGTVEIDKGTNSSADFYLISYPGVANTRPELTIENGFDPNGEIYSIELGEKMPAEGYRFTTGWGALENKPDYIPFVSTQGYAVKEIEGELWLVVAHDHAMIEGGDVVEFEKLTIPAGGITLTDGAYYLTGTVTMNSKAKITINGNVKLCLNNCTINGSVQEFINIPNGASLQVCDCGSEGGIHSTSTSTIYNIGEFVLYSGDVVSTIGWALYNMQGTATIYGGEISGSRFGINHQSYSVSEPAILTLIGGTITGGNSGILYHGSYASMSMKGNPVITGTYGDIDLGNSSDSKITMIGALTGTDTYSLVNYGKVTEKTPRQITVGWDTDNASVIEYPFYDFNGQNTVYKSVGELWFKGPHEHFMAITDDCEDGGVQPNGVNADKVIFSLDLAAALENSNTLTTGSYVLNDDFTYSSDIHISGKVDICLQGNTLTLDSTSSIRMIVGAGATLRICDCVGTGEVHGKSYQCVEINDPTGALHLYGGNLHTDSSDCVTTKGTVHIMGGAIDSGMKSGINCYKGNTIVHVYDGSVSGYTNGILTYYTEVKVVDGRIESRTARGIWVGSDTTVEVSGGTIIGKTYGLEMRTDVTTLINTQIILKGDPVINGDTADISLIKDYKITVGGKLTGTDTYSVAVQTGPTPEAPVQITTGWATYGEGITDYPFESADEAYRVKKLSAPVADELYLVEAHKHAVSVNCEKNVSGAVNFEELILGSGGIELTDGNYVIPDGDYVLKSDVILTGEVGIRIEGNVNLCLNGHSITLDSGYMTLPRDNKGTLSICDCIGGGKITSASPEYAVGVNGGCTLNLYGGTIEATVGNGISNYGQLNIYGGSIDGKVNGINNGATLNLYGSPVINGEQADINLAKDSYINLMCEIVPANGETYSVAVDKTLYTAERHEIRFTQDWTEKGNSNKDYFVGANPAFLVVENEEDGELYLKAHIHVTNEETGEFTLYDKILDNTTISDYYVTRTNIDSVILDEGNYYFNEDIIIPTRVFFVEKPNVNVCLNGCTVNINQPANGIRLTNGASFIVDECGTNGIGELHSETFYNINGFIDGLYGVSHVVLRGGTIYLNGTKFGLVNYSVAGSTITVDGATVILTTLSGHPIFETADNGKYILKSGVIENYRYDFCIDTNYDKVSNSIQLGGDIVINSNVADISLRSGDKITIIDKVEPSDGEPHTIWVHKLPTKDAPVQITTGWEKFRTETIPFVSAQNYLVCERTVNNVTELYIVAPTVETDTDENGTLTAAPEYGPVGTLVTLTAKPNEGYKYGTVTVTYTDADGKEVAVPVTDNGDGTYTFTMPAVEVVNAYATFKLVHKHAMSVECEETGTVVDFNKELGSNFTGGTLTAGSYVLTDDVLNISKDITISGYVDICLNGKTLDLGDSKIDLNNAVGKLRICDCQGGGTITSSNTTATINIGKNICQFYLYGGTIESTEAAGVYQPNDGYSHYAFIYGGNIHGKTDGIYSSSYTEINSDVATITADEGYAVRVVNGDFCLAGSSELNGKLADIYLASGCVIDIDGKVNPEIPYSIDLAQSLSAVDQKIRITTDWTAEGDNSDPSVFYSVDGYEIYLETDGELYVKLHVHTHADGTTIIYNKALTQAVMDQYKGTDQLPEGNYVLLQDITSNTVHFTQDSNLCLFGHRITTTHNDESFYSEEALSGYGKSASLRIEDCTGEGIIDTATVTSLHRAEITVAGGNINVNGGRLNSGIYTYANGSFIMEAGNITVNNVQYGIGDVQYTGSAYLRGGELTAENFGVLVNMPIYLSGSPKITSGEADFALFTTDNLGTKADDTIIIEGKLIPNGEIYTVFSADELSDTVTKLRITTDWEKSGLASVNEGNNGVAVIPFKSTQGYDVVELDYTRADGTVTKELYLVKHEHCVYGANCEDVKAGEPCTHGTIWFDQPLDQEMMESFDRDQKNDYVLIPSGHYFLTSDIDMEIIVNLGLRVCGGNTVYLCLNGHAITNQERLDSCEGATLYICDCKNDPVTGKNQGRINVNTAVWSGLENAPGGGYMFHHGGTINVSDDSYTPLAVYDGGEFVLDGGTYSINNGGGEPEAIYGLWYGTGLYPKLTFKSGTIEHTGDNFTVAQYGDSYVILNGTVKINNDNAPADFYLNPRYEVEPGMTVLTITETFDPQGEIYSIYLDAKLSSYGNKYRFTDGWESAGLDHIPFISVQGYMVVEMDYNGHRELYLVKPQADVYLWNGHDVTATGTQLFDAMYSYDPNYLTTIQDWTFTIPEVELETAGLPVGSDGNGITFDAVVGGFGGDAWVTIQQVDEESGAVLKTERLLVTLNIHVYDVKDSVYILDYAHPVKLNETIFAQDTMPGIGIDSAVKFETFGKTEPVIGSNGLSMTIDPLTDGKGLYGLYTISEDGTEIIYTPNAMLDGKDDAFMIFRAHKTGVETSALGTSDPFKEVEMYKSITILPANVVYYEDTNEALQWNTDSNVKITVNTVGESNTGYQDGSNTDEYGNDNAYTYAPGSYTGSGGTYKDIVIDGEGTILSFTFTGTGFDLLGRTNATSGSLEYIVYTVENGVEEESYRGLLDTMYKDGEIYEAPLLHKEMDYGTYKVEINSVVKYNWDYEGEWEWNDKIGWYVPPAITSYLQLDGVRIYNPLSMTDENREHYNKGEKEAQFVQLRNLILDKKAASATFDGNGIFTYGSGNVFYLETAQHGMSYKGNMTSNLDDYLVAGPNNEVYFNSATQSVVLYVKETEAGKGMLQIGVRNLNPKALGGTGDAVRAPGLILIGEGGATMDTLVSNSKAIGYTEQYYTVDFKQCVTEEIGGQTYYRVVLSAQGANPFSMSNVKYSNLEFAEIPEKAETLTYNQEGTLIEEVSYKMPNLQSLVWQLRAAYDMLPEDELEPVDEAMKFMAVSLTLHSSIGMKIYVNEAVLEGYEDPYVLIEKFYGDEVIYETRKLTVSEEVKLAGAPCLIFLNSDMTSKEMSATVRMTLYAKKDGVLTRGEVRDYGILTYAKNTLGKTTDPNLKTLLVDMLNYGAQAQDYFDYHEEFLANSTLTEEEKAWATVEEPTLNSAMIMDDPKVPGNGNYGFCIAGASLLLKDKVELNYFINVQEGDLTGKKLMLSYVDGAGNDVILEIPAEDFVLDPSGLYKVNFDGLNAKDMRVAVTCWVADEQGERMSNALTYSIESYAASKVSNEALKPLLLDMMKYGDAALNYFNPKSNN